MFKRIDVMAYDKFIYIANEPSIELSKDNFYGGFSLQNPSDYNSIVDDTIYYAKAFFKKAVRPDIGSDWIWEETEVKLEKCQKEKFGEDFQEVYKNINLNNFYCFKEINESLFGHFSYNNYSFFFIQLFPCKNTTENNNKCKSKKEIDIYLQSTFFSMEFEDVELSPENYYKPVTPRIQDIYFKVGKKFFQEVHIYYQKIKTETDTDILGLKVDEINDLKKQDFLKYHSKYEMTSLIEEDIYETGNPFCNITIKLTDQIRIQRRTYPKLFSIWGDVGGFMEIVKKIFEFLTCFTIDILYEISVVNNLFNYDLNKRIPYSKTFKIDNKNNMQSNEKKLNSSNKGKLLKEKTIKSFTKKSKKHNTLVSDIEKILKKNNTNEERDINSLYSKFNYDTNNSTSKYIFVKKNKKNKLSIINNNFIKKVRTIDNNIQKSFIDYDCNNLKIQYKKKVKLNCVFIYLFPCFAKCNKNRNIIFLNKGIEFFKSKMDIFYIFKKLSNNNKNINDNIILFENWDL